MAKGKGARKAKTVLFIDDEALWLNAIKMAVQGEPFKLITADSGESALRKLQRAKPDLILSDVRMPVMNGFDLFEKVKSNPSLRTVPYVFMSSIDDLDARRVAKNLGADDYVEKPFDSRQVRTVIQKLLTRFDNHL